MLDLQLIIVHKENVYWYGQRIKPQTGTFCTDCRHSTIQLLRTVVPI